MLKAINETALFYDCRFPREETLLKKWLMLLGYEENRAVKDKLICSKHFEPSDFIKITNRTYLKPDAVPKLFLSKEVGEPSTSGDSSLSTVEVVTSVETPTEIPSTSRSLEASHKKAKITSRWVVIILFERTYFAIL